MGKIKQLNNYNEEGDYLYWLRDLVYTNVQNGEYNLLFKLLFRTDFVWSVPNDDNRIQDGFNLRSEYLGYGSEYLIDMDVSVLEVLIGISIHMVDMIYDGDENILDECFWILIQNLHLNEYDDDNYNSYEVNNILTIWMERSYSKSGKGGLFPLSKPLKNQRRVEIWYQMSQYLLENYTF